MPAKGDWHCFLVYIEPAKLQSDYVPQLQKTNKNLHQKPSLSRCLMFQIGVSAQY